MSSQDVITYKPEKIVFIMDEKRSKLFADENLYYVINFLRKGPMSIQNISSAFEFIDEKKSNTSIYRYLNRLIEAKLVAKAGKRITTKSESNLTSETLYMRTAFVYIVKTPLAMKEKDEIQSPIFDAMYLIFKQKYNSKKNGEKEFKDLLYKLDKEKNQYIMELLEKADEETNEKINELEGQNIMFALEYAAWLAILMKHDLKDELEKIYSS